MSAVAQNQGGVELHSTSPSNQQHTKSNNSTSPSLSLAFKGLNVVEKTLKDPTPYSNIWKSVVDIVDTFGESLSTEKFYRVKDADFIIEPGTMTLVISPPGGGRSSLLKAISARVDVEFSSGGGMYVNGTMMDRKVNPLFDDRKAITYSEQVDTNMLTMLTAAETLEFTAKLAMPQLSQEELTNTVNDTLKLLNLQEAASTTVNKMSGGQKKRLNLGEALINTTAKIHCLDHATDGLDSATSQDILQRLQQWTRNTNGSIVCTLQSPSPDLFNLFDHIIILNYHGEIIFNGPRTDITTFLRGMHFVIPSDQDLPDFIMEVITRPADVLEEQRQPAFLKQNCPLGNGECGKSGDLLLYTAKDKTQVIPSATPCDSIARIQQYYCTTPYYHNVQNTLGNLKKSSINNTPQNDRTMQSLSILFPLTYQITFFGMLMTLLLRQWRCFVRNKPIFIARVINAILMSLFYGSLYYFVDHNNPSEIVAQEQLSLTLLAFSQMLELPISIQFVEVSLPQMHSHLFSPLSFVVSSVVMAIPITFVEVSIYSLFIYFMTHHVTDVARFFVFFAICFAQSAQFAIWFKLATAVTQHPVLAQALSVPSCGLMLTLGGVFLFRSSIPYGMIWMYYMFPVSYTIRALVNNEYLAGKYDQLVMLADGPKRYGDILLESIDMFVGNRWIWSAIVMLVGFAFLSAVGMIILLGPWVRPFYEMYRGTKRKRFIDNDNNNNNGDVNINVATNDDDGNNNNNNNTILPTLRKYVPFEKCTLTFENVKLTVDAEDSNGKHYERTLLQNITSACTGGQVTYLMGASGAGKTTLLNVIAQRANNIGKLTGDMYINNQTITPTLASQLIYVVEQFDTLFDFDTVFETLLFTARLKLSEKIPDDIKKQIVYEILEILNLTKIKDELIWVLSPAQRKLVNIGLGLCCPAPILALDEPTTGISSDEAASLMNVVRKIASFGKVVIATIHQPSAQVFYLADSLICLAPGGYLMYAGPTGYRSAHLVSYFESLKTIDGSSSLVPKLKPETNPSEWLLEGLLQLDKNTKQEVIPALYLKSNEYQNIQQIIKQQQQQTKNNNYDSQQYNKNNIFLQFIYLFRRNFHYLLRNPFYVVARLIMCIGLAVVFGLIYFQACDNPQTQAQAISAIGAAFVPIFFAALLHTATGLSAYFELRKVFYRETQNGYYYSFLWVIVNICTEVLWVIVTILITQQPLYFLVGLPADGAIWGKYLMSFFALVMTFITTSFVISTISPNYILAQILAGVYYMATFSLCGLAIAPPNLPSGYYWLYKALTLGHALESIIATAFEKKDQIINIVMNGQTIQVPFNAFIFQYLGIEPGHYGWMLFWIMIYNLITIGITLIATTFIRYKE